MVKLGNDIDYNCLFTQNVIHKTINNGDFNIFDIIAKSCCARPFVDKYISIIEEIYNYMLYNYRNEYIYINLLFNKLFNGNLKRKVALTQIPIGQSKADFIFINGKAEVYEIKTEHDSFTRLEKQINDYYKAFNHVSLLTTDKYLFNAQKTLPLEVGILYLDSKSKIKVLRKPIENNSHLSHKEIFFLLRKKEFENILKKYYKELPEEPSAFYYTACFEEFSKIPIQQAYNYALIELKQRKIIDEKLFIQIPLQLKSLIYFSELSKKQLILFLNLINQTFAER